MIDFHTILVLIRTQSGVWEGKATDIADLGVRQAISRMTRLPRRRHLTVSITASSRRSRSSTVMPSTCCVSITAVIQRSSASAMIPYTESSSSSAATRAAYRLRAQSCSWRLRVSAHRAFRRCERGACRLCGG